MECREPRTVCFWLQGKSPTPASVSPDERHRHLHLTKYPVTLSVECERSRDTHAGNSARERGIVLGETVVVLLKVNYDVATVDRIGGERIYMPILLGCGCAGAGNQLFLHGAGNICPFQELVLAVKDKIKIRVNIFGRPGAKAFKGYRA